MGTIKADDKYSGALAVCLARSRIVPAFIALACTATLALLALTPLPIAPAILGGTWTLCLSMDALRRARPRRRLAIDREGSVIVDGVPGHTCAGSFVAPWLTVIRWRPVGARLSLSLLVVPDMLPANEFRQLRVLLKTGDGP